MTYKLEICPCCKKKRKLTTFRRSTQYTDDSKNWLTCCKDCKKQDDAHFDAQWKDYYESQGFGGFW